MQGSHFSGEGTFTSNPKGWTSYVKGSLKSELWPLLLENIACPFSLNTSCEGTLIKVDFYTPSLPWTPYLDFLGPTLKVVGKVDTHHKTLDFQAQGEQKLGEFAKKDPWLLHVHGPFSDISATTVFSPKGNWPLSAEKIHCNIKEKKGGDRHIKTHILGKWGNHILTSMILDSNNDLISFSIDGFIRRWGLFPFKARSLALKGNVGKKGQHVFKISAHRLEVFDCFFPNWQLDILGNLDALKVLIKSQKKKSSQLLIDMFYSMKDKKIRIGNFIFTCEKDMVFIREPIHISLDPFSVSHGSLLCNQGYLRFKGIQKKNDIWSGNIDAQNIPLTLFGAFYRSIQVTGWANGKVSISGQKPDITWSAFMKNVAARWTNMSVKSAALCNVDVKGSIDTSGIYNVFSLKTQDNTLTVHSVIGSAIDLQSRTIMMRVHGEGKLDVLSIFLPSGDRLSGHISSEFDVSGTLVAPKFSGSMRVRDGHYEIGEYGTSFFSISGEIFGQGRNIYLKDLHAFDQPHGNKKGSLSGKGHVNFSQSVPHINLQLALKDYAIVQMDGLFMKSSGDLSMIGQGTASKVSGNVDICNGELFLDPFMRAKIPTLKVMGSKKVLGQRQHIPDQNFFPLNIHLNIKDSFMIKGMGLSSSWKGNLFVRGPIHKGFLIGKLDIKKGHLDIVKKRLLLRDCWVRFDDGYPNDPYLYFIATRKLKDILLSIKIDGYTSSPQFSFVSDPALTQEEVLAYLFFDQSIASLSLGQTFQLATLLGSFKSNNLDFIDSFQNLLGLDNLELKQVQGKDGTSQQVVKFVKEFGNIKLALEQGVTETTGTRASAEFSITDDVSAGIELGDDMSSGVGLTWGKSY